MSDCTLTATGRCLCGAVSYACEVDTSSVMICHCAECQVMGSTAYRIGAFLVGDQISLSGEVRDYGREGAVSLIATGLR